MDVTQHGRLFDYTNSKTHMTDLIKIDREGKDAGLTLRCAVISKWSEFLATDTEVPGSVPGATRFSE